MKNIAATDLEVGKRYYFDGLFEASGVLKSVENKQVVFTDIENNVGREGLPYIVTYGELTFSQYGFFYEPEDK